jgi:branched-subunit amino acid aminotransferase/4-amino-4-deoxychorismate lyase
VNEALLVDPHGNIYEGLTSNFACIALGPTGEPTVFTAPQDLVLQGTIFQVVVKVCNDLQIPLEFSFPNIQNCRSWMAAFLTSQFLGHFWF